MANWDDLKLQPGDITTTDEWNSFIDDANERIQCIAENLSKKILTIDGAGPAGNIIVANSTRGQGLHIHVNKNSYITNRNNFVGNGFETNSNLLISTNNNIYFQTGEGPDTNHGSNRLAILQKGNVGIGTASPIDNVEIHTSQYGGLSIWNSFENKENKKDTGGYNALRFFTTRKNESLLFHTGTKGKGNKGWQLSALSDDFGVKTDHRKGDLRFHYYNDTKWITSLILKSNGNVGIGTEAPAEKLHVNGSIRGNSTNGALKIETTKGWVNIGPQNADWSHFTTDRPKFYFNKEIRVNGGKIGSHNTQNLSLCVGGSSKMVIMSNGNVGIGTTAPKAKLDVVGDIKASKSIIGNVLSLSGGAGIRGSLSVEGKIYANTEIHSDGIIYANGSLTKSITKGVHYDTDGGIRGHGKEGEDLSILAKATIAAPRFSTYSDEQLKFNVSNLNHEATLEKFAKLVVKNYRYKNRRSLLRNGFIAQEVEKVIPEAIAKMSCYAPNICKGAKLNNIDKYTFGFNLNTSIKIEKGDLIRIYADKKYDLPIERIDGNSFIIKKFTDKKIEQIFVYGTKVNDLMAIDYDHIFTMNVAVTQKLGKEIKMLKREIQKLKSKNKMAFA